MTKKTDLTFVTGNTDKFAIAQHTCQQYGIQLTQIALDIDEVQSENGEYIARQKALAAFALVKQPVIISDDSWSIPALRGFPGPYMKSINHWFTTDDMLRLIEPYTDRTILLHQILVFQDSTGQHVFKNTVNGQIAAEARGDTSIPSTAITILESDNGKTIAEVRQDSSQRSGRVAAQIWHDLIKWYKEVQHP